MDSIWKDIIVDFGAVASVNYNVEVTGYGEVFRGKAYARPGASTLTVRINDIVADAYGMLLALPWSAFSALAWPMEVVVNDLDSTTEMYREQVMMDWSYRYDYDPSLQGMSDPVKAELHYSQFILYTLCDNPHPATVTVSETAADGTVTTETLNTNEADGFFSDAPLLRRLDAAGSGTFFYEVASLLGDPVEVEVEAVTYKLTSCGDYVLYYVNAFGGWDSLIVYAPKQTDELKRHTVGVDYDNTETYARGRVNYVNEVQRKVTLHTGLLTDEQSSRMHHLLNSPCVYLHDLQSGDVWPVVLTNTVTEYKTYRNQGLRMADYTIEADYAVDMMRQ